MGASLMQPCRVYEEGLRVVKYFQRGGRRTLPTLDIQRTQQRCFGAFGNAETGAAWLSSARVVKCWVKSRNERNPYPLLPAGNAGNSKETASDKLEEGGDDVKSSWPLRVGLHTCYNGAYKEKRPRESKRTS
ncbi:unnamed protein product [Allacma fusca]|uniref:Uncharacterized protein n=1 Tax=Allacma fusca TaxID=39272 RepID=A0A8J2K919_9HEXA|nr:unnamed protein product [Allacma fusca]